MKDMNEVLRRAGRKPDGQLDWKKLRVEAAKILSRIRVDGGVDLVGIFNDPHKKGALAELEGSGAIRVRGTPDARWFVQYEVAPDPKTAEQWFNAKIRWPAGKPHQGGHKAFVLFDRGEDHG